jgi:hypothetical protein
VASLFDPLVLPPKLLLRALDDIHEMAVASRQVVDMGARLLELGERMDARAEAILGLGERIDARAQQILDVGEHIQGRADDLIALGADMHKLGGNVLEQGDLIEQRARDVAERAADIVAALPLLERALALGEPLEGAVERLGRMVDRLPGGAAARRRGPATPD